MNQQQIGAKLLSGAALVLSTMLVQAAPVQISGAFHFLDNVSANSFNFPQGLRQTFGAVEVTPNGDNGTVGAFTSIPLAQVTPQTFLNLPPGNALNYNNFTVSPNLFARTVDASAQNGAWSLGFMNTSGGSTDFNAVATPSIGNVAPVDHPTSVAISGGGMAPTFTWALPASATNIDAVRVQIWDRNTTVGQGYSGVGGAGLADVIYISTPDTPTSFKLRVDSQGFIPQTMRPDGTLTPPMQLKPDGLYSLEISLLDLRNPNGGVGLPNILSRTRSIFDFTFLEQGGPTNVYLPTVNLQNGVPTFQFNVGVQAGQQIFIDPLVAVGYDYQIGAGDPNFQTVLLPTGIGDGSYELYIWMDGGWVKVADIEGGEKYDFGANGVDRFRVLGIEPGAGLSPGNPTAFITGLEFVGNGVFSGTMTALTVNVPEPGSLALLGLAMGLLGMRRLAKRQA